MKKDRPPPSFPREDPPDFDKALEQLREDAKQYVRVVDRPWTEKEEEILREIHDKVPAKQIAERLRRTGPSIDHKLHRMNLGKRAIGIRLYRKRDPAQ